MGEPSGGRRWRVAAGLLGAVMAATFWAAPARAQAPVVVATFAGTLPCADCSGLRTVLTLEASSAADPTSGRYTLAETYEGRGVTRKSAGRWILARGTPTNPNASVYTLTDGAGGRPQFWLRVSERELRLLDGERGPIDSPVPLSLTRVEAPSHPPATTR